jgi:hypothetical protein
MGKQNGRQVGSRINPMDPEIRRFSLEDFLEDLKGGIQWLGTFGIQPARTRFSNYRKMLGLVLKHNRCASLAELRKRVPASRLPDGPYPIDGFSRRVAGV